MLSADNYEKAMRKQNLATMPFEDLWQLYEELVDVLADKITAEKHELAERSSGLNSVDPVREVRASPAPITLLDE